MWMKTIKCDRCGKDIPYVSPYANVYKDGKLPSGIMVSYWSTFDQQLREIDLCEECKQAVQNFIFDYEVSRHD